MKGVSLCRDNDLLCLHAVGGDGERSSAELSAAPGGGRALIGTRPSNDPLLGVNSRSIPAVAAKGEDQPTPFSIIDLDVVG